MNIRGEKKQPQQLVPANYKKKPTAKIKLPRGRAPFGQYQESASGDLWPGQTPEVRDSRTPRHSAHAQSQV